METLFQDLRYAIRSLRRSPAFTFAVILTLALGIGANTAIFNIVDAVLLRPLPYPASDRLAVLWGTWGSGLRTLAAVPDVDDWRARNHVFEDMGTIRQQSVNLTGREQPERLGGAFVTSNTLSILGAHAAIGRLIRPDESVQGAKDAVAVLSFTTWVTRFGGDTEVVGRSLTLNGRPHTVIGVLTSDFVDPYGVTEVWLPMASAPATWFARGMNNVWAIGRIKQGVSFPQAQRDLSAVAAQIASEQPATNSGFGVQVTPLRESIVGATGPVLLIVFGFVGIVLLIACANVANLQLARASNRRREYSVRAALGAGRMRLIRQLLTENLVLAGLGGALGFSVAVWTTQALVAVVPGGIPAFSVVNVDMRVLAFVSAMAIGAGLAFGCVSAFYSSRVNLSGALGSRTGDGNAAERPHLRDFLVAAQLAMCVVLLVGASLVGRSFAALKRVEMGFDARNLLTAQLRLPPTKYRSESEIALFMSRAIDEIRAVPGVRAAALVRSMPLTGNFGVTQYEVIGSALASGTVAPTTQQNSVGDGFFRTMAIPLEAGRDFNAEDRAGSQPVAIVNDEFARREWPGASPLGKRIKVIGPPDVVVTIVGIVGNVKQQSLGEVRAPQLYQPVTQAGGSFTSLVIRAAGNPSALASAVRNAVWRVDPDQPVWGVRTMATYIDQNLSTPRFTLVLTLAFALLSLSLALVGVYGVMSYVVSQRTREVGIRMALGARNEQILAMVLRRGARTVAAATGVGIVAAFGAARILQAQLYAIKWSDPATFVVVPAILIVVALVACYLPARRAARVDPVIALRQD